MLPLQSAKKKLVDFYVDFNSGLGFFIHSGFFSCSVFIHTYTYAETFSLMMMMNCFCGMVDRRKAFTLISSRDHCQRSSPSQISDTLRAGFEPAQNLSSGFDE